MPMFGCMCTVVLPLLEQNDEDIKEEQEKDNSHREKKSEAVNNGK